ncbi:E3 ubiquitin-protein ligase TRIM39-like [Hoplias malabaricus]|uniref:E3 ubiquitin-protein ligase TRIM39-like n=1 Tax=Hoplias malabaricus TaxID=27720 RepID=UPI0034623CE0
MLFSFLYDYVLSLWRRQNSAAPQDTQQDVQNMEESAEDTVTVQRSTLKAFFTINVVIILIILGALVITAAKLMEMKNLQHSGLTDAQKNFPSLTRNEGIVPDDVWRWIKAAKADVTLKPQSAHVLLRVSNDGKRLYQASTKSPPRVPTAETYLKCICVSSKTLPSTRIYFELEVSQTVLWTVGFREASFDADHDHDMSPGAGIWTIASKDGKIVINDGNAIPTPYATPARLSLYLDYKRGQLSFYDPLTKFHLYTYLATLKKKLYFYAAVNVGIEETHDPIVTLS